MEEFELPSRGFTRAENEWIENELKPFLDTLRIIDGENFNSQPMEGDGILCNAQTCE